MTKKIILIMSMLLLVPSFANEEAESFAYTIEDLNCMAQAIHYEARGESDKGKAAVGHVVLNRANNERFPSTICGVVKQKSKGVCQFSWNCVKIRTTRVSDLAYELAYKILEGTISDPTKGSLFFHANHTGLSFNRKRTVMIGNHIFYR